MELSIYRTQFLDYLSREVTIKEPKNLYEPIHYILQLGGKRLRPVLALLACDLFEGDSKKALPAALAIEMFHNFSLVHDDIMDHATLRRGKETVHKKWNINTGILSGDAMVILTNICMEYYQGVQFKTLMSLYNKTALEVCIGQQYDIDFENQENVSIPDYMEMIKLKTAVLIACALKMGAIIANAKDRDVNLMYDFGLNLGLAFQLQDDYLDTFGNEDTFGKRIGGDIIENKKTFLYLKTRDLTNEEDNEVLQNLYNSTVVNDDEKIKEVTRLFKKYEAHRIINEEIERYTQMAYDSLSKTSLSVQNQTILKKLGNDLLNRTS